ncbi:MAG: serine hydrolase domain-containing protein [Alphaproteobacteria bacterium]
MRTEDMLDFSSRLADAARRFSVRQIAGALIVNGETQFSAAHAEFDCDTPQPVFCLAKVMTASLIALAIERGRLSIDTPVEEFLDFDGGDRRVTKRHLIGHMHGWENAAPLARRRDANGFIAAEDILTTLARKPRLHAPGAMYSYDSAGYLLLGAVLERIHGARFDDILQRHLFAPLAMFGAEAPASACPAGDGDGISLSVRDLSRFVAFHLPGGADAARLLAPRVLDCAGMESVLPGRVARMARSRRRLA